MAEQLNRRRVGQLRARLPDAQLQKVRDPRRRPRSVKWPVASVLKTALVGMVAGCNSLADLELLTQSISKAARRWLGLRGRLPDTTARDLLVQVDPQELRRAIARQVITAHKRKALKHEGLPFGFVSLDGKATAIKAWDDRFAQLQRHGGSASGASGIVRTITACLTSTRSCICLDAAPIPPSTNESGHYQKALTELLATYGHLNLFRVAMYDAGACSEANARFTCEQGLEYFMCLNEGQPTLYAEARAMLGARTEAEAEGVDEHVEDGKVVRRLVFLTEDLAGFLDWSHLQTVVRIQCQTFDSQGQLLSGDDHYYLTSLCQDALTPRQWIAAARRRWAVENNCHHTWDVAFREDERPWIDSDPQGTVVVMLLRRLAYNLLALYRNVTLQSEENRRQPWRRLILSFYNALIATTEDQLAGLRRRSQPPLPSR